MGRAPVKLKPLKTQTKKINFKDYSEYLTEEEIIIKFQPLVNSLLKSWRLRYEYDDLVQVGSIGLLKAYRKYDSESPVTFVGYATRVITNEYLMMNKSTKEKDIIILSLNERAYIDSKDNSEVEFMSLLRDEFTNVEDEAVNNVEYIKVRKALTKLSDLERKAILLSYYSGSKNSEIAGLLDTSPSSVSRVLKRSLIKLRKILNCAETRNNRFSITTVAHSNRKPKNIANLKEYLRAGMKFQVYDFSTNKPSPKTAIIKEVNSGNFRIIVDNLTVKVRYPKAKDVILTSTYFSIGSTKYVYC